MRVDGQALIVAVGDIIRTGAVFWEVTGVCLGEPGQEDVYELTPCTQGVSTEGPALVPRIILEILIRTHAAVGHTRLWDYK